MSERTQKTVAGKWVLHEGKPVFEEVEIISTYDHMLGIWNKKVGKPTYKSPSEIGYLKEFTLTILFKEERPNPRKFKGIEIAWFMERKKIKVREDREHVWLLWQDNKLFLKDVWNQQCFPVSLKESTVDVLIEELDEEPQYLSRKDLEEVLKTSDPKMIFSKKDDDGNYGLEVR